MKYQGTYLILPKTLICSLLLFLMIGFSLASKAQQNQSSPVNLAECAAIENINLRVNCYDELARAQASELQPSENAPEDALTSSTSSEPVSQDPPILAPTAAPIVEPDQYSTLTQEVVPEVVIPQESLSQTEELDQFGREASIEVSAEGEKELFDTVVALRQSTPNKWLITLSSGQIWRQDVAERFMIKVNDKVRIYPSNWGNSFRLSVEGRRAVIQVKRIDSN